MARPFERRQLLDGCVAVEIDADTDVRESHRRLLVDAEGAAEVEVPLDPDGPPAKVDTDRRGDRAKRDSDTCRQRLQQHVSRAKLGPVSARRRMQAGFSDRATGV